MTRPSKRSKRPSLFEFVTARLDGPLRAALAAGGGDEAIARAVAGVLQTPEVELRARAASPQERDALQRKHLPDIINRLQELHADLPLEPFEPGGPRTKHLPALDEAARRWPELAAPDVGERLKAASPETVDFLLNATAAGIISAADDALKESAGDGEAPTQHELAAWVAVDCQPETLRDVADRLAVLWGLDPAKVTVTGWALGGLMTWRDGEEWHAPAGDLLDDAKAADARNPLAPLVLGWQRRPVEGRPNLRPDRILPTKLAMVDPSHVRAGRLLRLFSPAAHRRGQLVLPGFGDLDTNGPALPLALFGLGQDNPHRGGSPAAPLALRLFVEAVLAVEMDDRRTEKPIALEVTLRDLLARLYPGPRKPRPNEYWPRLMRAVEALDAMDARIPWVDPDTGRGQLRRVVSVGGIPRGPGALDDVVRMVVDLPPGSGPGPQVPPTLGEWGARSAPAYNALLNLAYRWFDPGQTRHPTRGGGFWLQSQDPARYPELSDADVVAITRPLSARAARRNLTVEGWETLRELEDAGDLRIEGRRILPPGPVQRVTLARAESDVSPCRE